jgi:hypothetical protein
MRHTPATRNGQTRSAYKRSFEPMLGENAE